MDVYGTLKIDESQVLFTVLHQAGPAVPEEDFTRTVTALHVDICGQVQAIGNELRAWLQQHST